MEVDIDMLYWIKHIIRVWYPKLDNCVFHHHVFAADGGAFLEHLEWGKCFCIRALSAWMFPLLIQEGAIIN